MHDPFNQLHEQTLLDSIMDNMPHMMCLVDRYGNIIRANSRLESILGCRSGASCPSEGLCSAHKLAGQAIETRAQQETNVSYKGRIFSVKFVPIEPAPGQALGVWTDITGHTRLNERLALQNDMLRNDLDLARKLQLSMLSDRFPEARGYSFYSHYHPCQAVGGDFYDVFPVGKGKCMFYIADVSGHGVASAMLTVFLAQTIRSMMQSVRGDITPREILNEVWRRFDQMGVEEHLYITVWLAVLNFGSGELIYSNAGHIVAPLLYNGKEIVPLELSGYPICRWMPEADYSQKTTVLPKKGRLLLYTDGLSDAWRMFHGSMDSDEIDSPDSLARDCLLKQKPNKCLDTIWGKISSGADGELTDDIAMLLVSRK